MDTRKQTGRNRSGLACYSKSFNGVSSQDELKSLVGHGYIKPVASMVAEVNRIRTAETKRFRQFSSPVGYAPIVPNALMGLPNSMVDSKMVRLPMKVVRIKYLNQYTCDVGVDEAEKAGVKLVGAILKLESMGYRVSLDVVCLPVRDVGCKDVAYVSTNVKEAQQPMDLQRMSFPLVHPAFFRSLTFQWYAKSACQEVGFGLGTNFSRNGAEETRDVIRALENDKNAVVLDINEVIRGKEELSEEIIKKMLEA